MLQLYKLYLIYKKIFKQNTNVKQIKLLKYIYEIFKLKQTNLII